MYNLKNKVALITGASGKKGIGRSIALRLAKEGVDIAINDIKKSKRISKKNTGLINLSKEIEKIGRKSLILEGDVSKSSDVISIFKKLNKEFGRLDILINNAAAPANLDRVPLIHLNEKIWDNIIKVNLKGTFLCCKYAAKLMIKKKSNGKIINISSTIGKDYVKPNYAAYASSKFGVRGLTQVLAKELGKYGIQVNAICPGVIITERTKDIAKSLYNKNTKINDAIKKYTNENLKETPLGRLCSTNDVAQLVAFLASSESDFITGKSITLDGGKHTD